MLVVLQVLCMLIYGAFELPKISEAVDAGSADHQAPCGAFWFPSQMLFVMTNQQYQSVEGSVLVKSAESGVTGQMFVFLDES